MIRPLYKEATESPAKRPPAGHAGLWFDKFCNRWELKGGQWILSDKLGWINTVTGSRVGTDGAQIEAYAGRMARLVGGRGGRFSVFTSESRFVTGIGRSHPVENGFGWHPTLGTPYLPGSSIKGTVRAWAEQEADPPVPSEVARRLLGNSNSVGSICFLDAVPLAPVQLEGDVITPHYAGWTAKDLPGDWRPPTPIPFLVTSPNTSFLVGLLPRTAVADDDMKLVMSWLSLALEWSGAGAKTAVGYGRFTEDKVTTEKWKQRIDDEKRKDRDRIREAHEAAERAEKLASMNPVERDIEEILKSRPNQNEPDITAILRAARNGRWEDGDRVEVAMWLERRMKSAGQWTELSRKKNPSKDKPYQNTLLVKTWLKD